ncbi:MAG: M48 family metallopeptidase [Candidatus Melainabacteria bacterium]|nr:M48 family metallopeptidase [Candidatus Melainabacteria bacterium]
MTKSRDRCSTTDRSVVEVYQAFMTGYTQRINRATFNVTIGGVKIGAAKYSRLAQINLANRIITFSRYAIENVPERGRRYLVIHELAHVKEPSHNKRFWELVGQYEPSYRQVGRALELAFQRNIKEDLLLNSPIKIPNPLNGRLEQPKLLLSPRVNTLTSSQSNRREATTTCASSAEHIVNNLSFGTETVLNEGEDDIYACIEDVLGTDVDIRAGIMCGGSEIDLAIAAAI